MRPSLSCCSLLPLLSLLVSSVSAQSPPVVAAPDITLDIRDFATMPMTGKVNGTGQNLGLLARVNFMREEPGVARDRVFVNDLNGPLYILDKKTGKLTTYLNFNGRDSLPGLFHRLPFESGFGNGFISFALIPTMRATANSIRSISRIRKLRPQRCRITRISPGCTWMAMN